MANLFSAEFPQALLLLADDLDSSSHGIELSEEGREGREDREEEEEEELLLLLLLLLVSPQKRVLPPRPNLLAMDPAFSRSLFRFTIQEIEHICQVVKLPPVITTRERYTFSNIEAMCILLRRMTYPARWFDLELFFGRSSSALCSIFLLLSEILVKKYKPILYLDRDRIAGNLERFSRAIRQAGAPLDTCWGFIDGTVRPISKPVYFQRQAYNGHKRVHSLKFHSVVCPDGIIGHIFGPIEGRRHDTALLRESLLQETIESDPRFQGYVLYGDPAYPVTNFLCSPYKGAYLNQNQMDFNRMMSSVRICVEWNFGRILNLFSFLEFKRAQKV